MSARAACILCIAFLLSPIVHAQADLPADVRVDLLALRVKAQWQDDDMRAVLDTLDRIDALGVPASEVTLMMRGIAHERIGDPARAAETYLEYLAEFGARGRYTARILEHAIEGGIEFGPELPTSLASAIVRIQKARYGTSGAGVRLIRVLEDGSPAVVTATVDDLARIGAFERDPGLLITAAAALERAGDPVRAHSMAAEYLRATGRDGARYSEALQLLLSTEAEASRIQAAEARAAERAERERQQLELEREESERLARRQAEMIERQQAEIRARAAGQVTPSVDADANPDIRETRASAAQCEELRRAATDSRGRLSTKRQAQRIFDRLCSGD